MADTAFGAGFIVRKRDEGRDRTTERAAAEANTRARAAIDEVIPVLRVAPTSPHDVQLS